MLVYHKLLPIKLLTSPRSSMVKKITLQGRQRLSGRVMSRNKVPTKVCNRTSYFAVWCTNNLPTELLASFDSFIPIASNFCTNSNWLKMTLIQSENFNFSVIFNKKRNLRRPTWRIFTMKCEVYTNPHWMNVSIRRFPFSHFYCCYS